MNLSDLHEKTLGRIPPMDERTRHAWLVFIHKWFSGSYMGKSTAGPLKQWHQYREMFPTGLTGTIPLYRLCTIPTNRVQPIMRFNPTVGVCSSWSRTKRALQFVAGIARELTDTGRQHSTSRIAIQADIPARLILATPQTVKKGFLLFSKDYHERYPMVQPPPVKKGGVLHYGVEQLHPDWPGDQPSSENGHFDTNEVGFLQDRLGRRGGFYGQNEYVVESPKQVTARLVKTFRRGDDELDAGWEE